MTDPSPYIVELLDAIQIPLVNRFYQQAGYRSKAGRGEQVWVARESESRTIVAAVRLQTKGDGDRSWWFLRAMCVVPDLRRGGVGSLLLKRVAEALGDQPCYCFPFDHLEAFYRQEGFQAVSFSEAPAWIADAGERLCRNGRHVLLMMRSFATNSHG
jgi:GNAT superfamily N-acetyltransferase